MTENKKTVKKLSDSDQKKIELAEKRAANLRANLQRRKVQTRERKKT